MRVPAASESPTVLITGASGALGSVLVRELPRLGWNVRSLSLSFPQDPSPDDIVGSVTDSATMLTATEGVTAIVHMGGVSVPGEQWPDYLQTNIGGTRTVLEAARVNGVARVALASSNHATGYTRRDGKPLPANTPMRPDSLYGVSKAAIEALGSFYSDEYGLSCANLRIGSCFARPGNTRALSTWLSYPDFVRLIQASVGNDWTGCETVWGISRNTRRWWSLDEGARIGFDPVDDSERFAAEVEGIDSDYVGGGTPPFAAAVH